MDPVAEARKTLEIYIDDDCLSIAKALKGLMIRARDTGEDQAIQFKNSAFELLFRVYGSPMTDEEWLANEHRNIAKS